jgi:hypothetical protein
MKNKENKPLRIVWENIFINDFEKQKVLILSNLAIAESNLIKASKQSALPHFIAIVKEIENLLGFRFEIIDESKESLAASEQ